MKVNNNRLETCFTSKQQYGNSSVVKFTGKNDMFKLDNQNTNNDKIDSKAIKENLKEGFKEGAKEFWNFIKKPKNLLIGVGVSALGIGALASLGLSFAACNVLFLGFFSGAAVLSAGKNLSNFYKHKNSNQNNLAKNDIKNVGKNLFDLTAITAPFAASSIIRATRCTYTYLEVSNIVKNSGMGKLATAQWQNAGKILSKVVKLERINFDKFRPLEKVFPRETLAKTKPISAINDFSAKIIRARGRAEAKIVNLIDNKLKLASLFENPRQKSQISSAILFEYMEDYKHNYFKIKSEINDYFGKIPSRQKSFVRLTQKAWKKGITPTNVHEIKDVIGARIVWNTPDEFQGAVSSLKRLAQEGRLVEVESLRGPGMHSFSPSQKIEMQKLAAKKGFIFMDTEKKNGYQAINAIVKNKETGKHYEVQIRGKHVDAIDSIEHQYYEMDPTGKLGAEKLGDNIYLNAAKADKGMPVDESFFAKLNEVFDPFYRKKVRISYSCRQVMSKIPRFIPGSVTPLDVTRNNV